MKSTLEKEKIDKKRKKKQVNNINDAGMLVQGILFSILLMFGIISLFYNSLFIIVESLIALLMFVIAYNNYKIYKRAGMSIVYIAFGLIVTIAVIMEIFNGS